MEILTFVVHPEWIKKTDHTLYRDLCAIIRVCIMRLQMDNPNWTMEVVHSDEKTITVALAYCYDTSLVEELYAMATRIANLDAKQWLRISQAPLPSEFPGLIEPPAEESVPAEPAETPVDDHDYLDTLCRESAMREYPVLADCLRTQAQTVRMLRKMGLESHVWHQNLLVAIDDRTVFRTFTDALYTIYREEGYTVKLHGMTTTVTTAISWEAAVSTAEKFAKQTDQARTEIILIIKVQPSDFDKDSDVARRALKRINSLNKKFLCVFRTSVQEMDLIERLVDEINDIMPVRSVVCPPVSTASLTQHFYTALSDSGCTLAPDCTELVERWIIEEQHATQITGSELPERIVRELILHKARENSITGTVDTTITTKDILQCMHGTSVEPPTGAHDQLAALIGVAEVKQRVLEIAAQIKVQRELADKGVERPAIHMMFTGNPGTGKTIVARIVAAILKEEGILSRGHLFEVNARDLCGRHVGETAPKVSAKCKDAYGSVLFVDEAYMLHQYESDRDFGPEALTTLMTEMENHRDDFCVILAGYPEDMAHLMTANPGLRSRIPYTVNFPNYSREELGEIFFQMLNGRFAYDDSLKTAVEEFFRSIPDEVMDSPDFSNARMVRNLYERVWGKAAYRKVLNNEPEFILRGEDLAAAVSEQDFRRLIETPNKKRPIGFNT